MTIIEVVGTALGSSAFTGLLAKVLAARSKRLQQQDAHQLAVAKVDSDAERVARDVIWQELTTVRAECASLRAEVKELREQLGTMRDAKSILAADHKVLLADHERLTRENAELIEECNRWRETSASLAHKVEAMERGEVVAPRPRGNTGKHSAIKPDEKKP